MNERSIIHKLILELDKPFCLSDLFCRLEEVGITDKALIMSVLDQLLNNGLVSPSDISDDVTVYSSLFTGKSA